jgi:hypothetical protein
MLNKGIIACVAALAPLTAAQAGPGLNGAYWVGGYGNNTAGTPTATFNTNTVCFPYCGGASNDGDYLSNFLAVPSGYTTDLSTDFWYLGNHAIKLTGFLNIATTGNYDLTLFSDDGSYMYIDDILVVNDGGDHAPQAVTHYGYNLTAGAHSLMIYQEENGGGTALSAFINGQALGGAWLSTGAAPEPASWALMVGGFGMIGGALRSRRRAAVTFA